MCVWADQHFIPVSNWVCACLCVSEIHRDFLHRPPSGYLPEEIWRKAGKSQASPLLAIVSMASPTQTHNTHTHTHTHSHHHQSSGPSPDQRPYSRRSIRPEDWRPSVSLGLNSLHLSPLWKATAVKAAVKMQSPGPGQATAAQHRSEINWSPLCEETHH